MLVLDLRRLKRLTTIARMPRLLQFLRREGIVLFGIWFAIAVSDRTWLALDHAIPSWDPADHLIGAVNFWWTLHAAQPFNPDWWRGLWSLSSKYPPLLYLSTAPLIEFWGSAEDTAIAVNLGFTAILLLSIYGLGRRLFNSEIGLWAAGLSALIPRFYTNRVHYFMDYPLVAFVTLSFWCLTEWWWATRRSHQWLWVLSFGVSFGLASFAKQTAIFFLFIPLLWVGLPVLWQRSWTRVLQLFSGILLGSLMIWPWFSTNWLFQISALFRSNFESAAAEGDPPVMTLAAWTYYWQELPTSLSYPLLLVPIAGLIWLALRRVQPDWQAHWGRSLQWLTVFFLGAYVIWSATANKDARYVMPYLPVLILGLAYGLTRWQGRWQWVRWGTVAISLGLLGLNSFPLAGGVGLRLAQLGSPAALMHPYTGPRFPHTEIVQAIQAAQPYQLINLGVLPSSGWVNQHNFNFYGSQDNFHLYARHMGDRQRHWEKDARSLNWFLSWSLDPDTMARVQFKPNELESTQQLHQRSEFTLQNTWALPDGTRLDLHRRQVMPIEIALIPNLASEQVQLTAVSVPSQVPPGVPIPVTYQWQGPWSDLVDGVVLLDWVRKEQPRDRWIHDHGIGLGTLRPKPIQANHVTLAAPVLAATQPVQVTEATAMLAPADLPPGTYTLQARYLNLRTQVTYPLTLPNAQIRLNPAVSPPIAPEPDYLTQLRSLATLLPLGLESLDPIFDTLDRVNLYDPIQYYLVDAKLTLQERLRVEPTQLNYAYALGLANALQLDVPGAIASLSHVAELDGENAYAHAYLGFVSLYGFRLRTAKLALDQAVALAPEVAEIQALSALSNLLTGHFQLAWSHAQQAIALSQAPV